MITYAIQTLEFILKFSLVGLLTLTSNPTDKEKDSKAERPNILFCIADDASMKSFGAYGDTFVNTPSIDRLAKEGVVFENAYNGNPKCSPARACILTGKYSWQLKEAADHNGRFPLEFKSYPQLLEQKGYRVGYTGKGWGPGVYDTKDNPAGPQHNAIKLEPPYKGITDVDYAANFEAFLEEGAKDAPFCFWLGTKEPHRFYELDSWKKAGRRLEEANVPPFYPDNEVVRGDLLDYANEVEWFDTHVGKAIKTLEKKGLLENTLVVITSDHGMPFPRVKGQIYEEGFHIPLIAYWKGKIISGRTVSDFVSFSDLAPTFMEVAGEAPHLQMTGRSIKKQLFASQSGRIDAARDHVLLGKERHDLGRSNEDGTDLAYPVRAIKNDSLLYVHNIKPERWPIGNPEYGFMNTDGSPTKSYLTNLKPEDEEYHYFEMNFDKKPEHELYNIQKDPHCINNLAEKPQYEPVIKKLRTQMETELIAQGDPRTLGKGEIFDNYIYYGKRLDYKTGKRLPPLKYTKKTH
ncbi:sulfatase family protein [Zobellia alginiliquefaciens]|uniref:sulfatase family protein n=1 Tax=Zobellia alginiliquefaciens TaxID=3032586 RepID=UPI0023E35732|nr:sulfatase [Zobellia alginiliquefaciens]